MKTCMCFGLSTMYASSMIRISKLLPDAVHESDEVSERRLCQERSVVMSSGSLFTVDRSC